MLENDYRAHQRKISPNPYVPGAHQFVKTLKIP